MRTCLIVGCGYVGSAFADFADDRGWRIRAVVRSEASRDRLRNRGWETIAWDWQTKPTNLAFDDIDLVLFAVSHANSMGDPQRFHPSGMEHVLEALVAPPPAIYLSTTGVFGPSNGEWVDESSPVGPTRPGSIAALAGESFLASHWPNRTAVLRLAGIYGPNRIPNLTALKEAQPISIDPDTFLNLIHVDDVVGVAMRVDELWQSSEAHRSTDEQPSRDLYCVSDGNPVLRREYYLTIAQYLGSPAPQFHAAMPQPTNAAKGEARPPSGRGFDHKRVSNRRLLQELGYAMKYPSFRDGLLPLLSAAGMS